MKRSMIALLACLALPAYGAKLNQTITFAPIGDQTLSTVRVPLSVSASSGLPISFDNLTDHVCHADARSLTVQLKTTGICTIRAKQKGNGQYNAAVPVTHSFSIAGGGSSGGPVVLPLSTSAWAHYDGTAFDTGYGYPVYFFNDATGDLYFDFPLSDPDCTNQPPLYCSSINYMWTRLVPKAIAGSLSITLRIDASDDAVFSFEPNGCTTPPSARPFIWAKNNDWNDGNRWWSRAAFTLAPGEITLTIPLDPSLWSGVFGKLASYDSTTLKQWTSALANVSSLGLTFGGGCFYGHGAYITSGAARFTVEDYRIIP